MVNSESDWYYFHPQLIYLQQLFNNYGINDSFNNSEYEFLISEVICLDEQKHKRILDKVLENGVYPNFTCNILHVLQQKKLIEEWKENTKGIREEQKQKYEQAIEYINNRKDIDKYA